MYYILSVYEIIEGGHRIETILMLRLHDVPFPANWPGMEIKRIFENKLSKGGKQFGFHRLKLIQRTY